jgi:hypothetical protein
LFAANGNGNKNFVFYGRQRLSKIAVSANVPNYASY